MNYVVNNARLFSFSGKTLEVAQLMKCYDISKGVVVALVRNKLQSLLTIIGVSVGVLSMVVVRAIGCGATDTIDSQIGLIGDNLLTILPEKNRKGRVHLGLGSSSGLTFEDCNALSMELGHILSAVSPIIYGNCQIIRRNRNWNVRVYGTGCKYDEIRKRACKIGSFFSEYDEVRKEKVCVIGESIRQKLFDEEEIVIGSSIRIDRIPFTIIGVLIPKGANAFGYDQDDVILVPYTSARAFLGSEKMSSVKMIDVSLYSMEEMETAKNEITALLRQRHKLSDETEEDFVLRDPIEIMKIRNSVASLASLMLSILAGISLLVGGIGIMNVMLVTVTERIKEIGLKMAIGARPKDILCEFLLEAFALSVVGGVVGALAGILLCELLSETLKWPIVVTIETITIGIIVSAAIGLIFGFSPAYKASRMNPIDCLRTE